MTRILVFGKLFPHPLFYIAPSVMAEIPSHSIHSSTYTGSEFSSPYYIAEPLSNLSDIHTQPHGNPFPSLPQYPPSWRPANLDEFSSWDMSHRGMFPLTPVGPGQDPDRPPHPQPAPPPNPGVAATSNPRKRKRTTPPNTTSSVGGFGPLSPGGTTTGSPTPSPPPPTPDGRRNGASDVWAFARPLTSTDEPPADQWPTPSEPTRATKPKTLWFGCKLCSDPGCVVYVSVFVSLTLTLHHDRSNGSGPKQWKIFQNNPGSSPTSSFRTHLEEHHKSAWERERTRLSIPTKPQAKRPPDTPEIEPFTREGLLKRLIKFILGDDQVCLACCFMSEDAAN